MDNYFRRPDLHAPMARAANNEKYAKPSALETILPVLQEAAFQQWRQATNAPYDPSPMRDYDMKGFHAAMSNPMHPQHAQASTGQSPYDDQMHYTDFWKTKYHPTFSADSQYARADAPRWFDNRIYEPGGGRLIKDERMAPHPPEIAPDEQPTLVALMSLKDQLAQYQKYENAGKEYFNTLESRTDPALRQLTNERQQIENAGEQSIQTQRKRAIKNEEGFS